MKKKKSFKKKFLGIMLSALLVSLPFVTSKPEKVKADDCYTHTNYYLFLSYRWIDTSTAPAVRQTSSVFPSRLPDGAKLDTLHTEWVPLSSNGNGGWSYSKFISYYSNWSGQGLLEASNNEWIYFHDKRWEESYTGELSDSATTTDMVAENFIYVPASNHDLAIADAEALSTSKNFVSIGVKRTYGSEWTSFASGHQNKHSFEPAVLKATFQVCPNGGGDNPGDDTWQSNVVFYYVDDAGNRTKIKQVPNNSYVNADGTEVITHNSGESYTKTCDDIPGYEHSTEEPNTFTLSESNKLGNCYYTKKSGGGNDGPISNKSCEVTYVDENNKKISNPTFNGTSLFNPNTLSNACSSYNYDQLCPDELTSNGNIYSRTGGKPAIDDDTTKVTCVYKTTGGNPTTGDKLIFVVWAVGLGAIAYSVYFFRNYYKKQKDV